MRGRTAIARCEGVTVIEALIGALLATTLFLGVWFTYDMNRKVWDRGRDKVRLQQGLTQAVEAIGRDVRAGSRIALSGPNDLTIFDRNGAVIRRYFIDEGNLATAVGTPVVADECVGIGFSVTPDTSEVRFSLTLRDEWYNSASIRGAAHLRNLDANNFAVGP